MLYQPTSLPEVFLMEPELLADDRGFFARIFCRDELAGRDLNFQPVQANLSGNHRRGTLRGLHYQAAPWAESKLVRVVSGAVFDVAVDLRRDSPTFGGWVGFNLSADNRRALFIPKGCAHGYLTLTDNAEVLYLTDTPYQPEAERGLGWNDPFVRVDWPGRPLVISDKDQDWPVWNPQENAQ